MDILKNLPVRSAKTAIFGPFGFVVTLMATGTQMGDLIKAKTSALTKLVAAVAGITYTFSLKNPKKAGLFAAAFALGQFYPEYVIYSLGDYVRAKRNGNASDANMAKASIRSYLGLYFEPI